MISFTIEEELMRRILSGFVSLVLTLAILAVSFGCGVFYERFLGNGKGILADHSDDTDLKLPGEVEKYTVYAEDIKGKLQEINEWATYAAEYQVLRGEEFTRYFLDDIAIPGTTNSVEATCTVVVKIGFSVDDISIQIDNDSSKIYISIPDPTVLDHYVIWDSITFTESNNILNPIDFEQYQQLFQAIEDEALEEAEKAGIYEEAEKNAQKIITALLAEYSAYEVVYL